MAIEVNLRDIQSGFLSASAIDMNNTLIEQAFVKALNREGGDNNAMEADLDLGLNNIINVDNLSVNSIDIDGTSYDIVLQNLADDAQQSADDASSSATKAFKWAEADEDVEVEPGKYSAKHFSIKAEASAARVDLGALDQAVADAELAETNALGHAQQASSSADLAQSEADQASADADRAELAQQTAAITAGIYPDAASGEAATSAGEYFWVESPESHEILMLRENTTGNGSIYTGKSLPSKALMESYSLSNGAISSGSVTVDTSAQTIKVNSRVLIGARTEYVLDTLDYSALAAESIFYVFYDVSGSALVGLTTAGVDALNWRNSEYIFLFSYNTNEKTLAGSPVPYTIDGMKINPNDKGHAQIYCQTGVIEVDSTARTITFPSGARISAGQASVTLPSSTVFDYSSESLSRFYVIYNADSGTFRAETGSEILTFTQQDFVVGLFDRFDNTFREGVTTYRVDGELQDAASLRAFIDGRSVTPMLFYPPQGISLDTYNKTLTLSSVLAVTSGNERYFINGVLDLSSLDQATAYHYISYNTETQQLEARSSGVLQQWSRKDVFICRVRLRPVRVLDLPEPFTINGKRSDEEAPAQLVSIRNSIAFPLDGVFSSEALPGYRPSDPTPAANITAADIYGWYDALMAENPDYITRELLGNEATGLPIYAYYFKPGLISDPVRPVRIMLQAAIHGLERMSYLYVYHFMRQVCENWQSDPLLEAVRFGVEVAVIPVLNPWGVNNGSRNNSNDVNINRNYPADWENSADLDKGASALSEAETQCSYNLMQSFGPDIFFDCHNFGTHANDLFLWTETMGGQTAREAAAQTHLMAAKWKKEVLETPVASSLGYVTTGRLPGAASVFAYQAGMNARTFEVNDGFLFGPDAEDYSALSVRFAVEAFGNALIYTLKKNYS